jgi:hypothetical protein
MFHIHGTDTIRKNKNHKFHSLNTEFNKIKKQKSYKDKLAELKNSYDKNSITKEEFETQKNLLLLNTYLQSKIDLSVKIKLSKEELAILSIQVFFEDIIVAQEANLTEYSYLFEGDMQPQEILFLSKLLAPILVQKEGGISDKYSFSGTYPVEDLMNHYMVSLYETINETNLTAPIVFALGSCNHRITLGYDPDKKGWIFIDVNKLPSQYIPFNNTQAVAQMISSSLSNNSIVSMATEIYMTKSNEETLSKFLNNLKDNKHWQELHTPTLERANLKDSYNSDWLYNAIKSGDMSSAKKLIELDNIDLNCLRRGGQITPLMVAIYKNNLEIVKLLLTCIPRINIDLKNPDGDSALSIAINNGQTKIIKELVEAGADTNIKYKTNNEEIIHILQNKENNKNNSKTVSYTPTLFPQGPSKTEPVNNSEYPSNQDKQIVNKPTGSSQ